MGTPAFAALLHEFPPSLCGEVNLGDGSGPSPAPYPPLSLLLAAATHPPDPLLVNPTAISSDMRVITEKQRHAEKGSGWGWLESRPLAATAEHARPSGWAVVGARPHC
jgi:hypothetical protein